MFDQDNADAHLLRSHLQKLDRVFNLPVVQPRRRLIHENHLGVCQDRPDDFQQFFLSKGQAVHLVLQTKGESRKLCQMLEVVKKIQALS